MANSESLGLLLRLVHQHWIQSIQMALEEAGLRNVPPSHANIPSARNPIVRESNLDAEAAKLCWFGDTGDTVVRELEKHSFG